MENQSQKVYSAKERLSANFSSRGACFSCADGNMTTPKAECGNCKKLQCELHILGKQSYKILGKFGRIENKIADLCDPCYQKLLGAPQRQKAIEEKLNEMQEVSEVLVNEWDEIEKSKSRAAREKILSEAEVDDD